MTHSSRRWLGTNAALAGDATDGHLINSYTELRTDLPSRSLSLDGCHSKTQLRLGNDLPLSGKKLGQQHKSFENDLTTEPQFPELQSEHAALMTDLYRTSATVPLCHMEYQDTGQATGRCIEANSSSSLQMQVTK